MSIYTKAGDLGQTDLYGKQRVYKDHPKVMAYGAVDELNASLGLIRAIGDEEDQKQLLWIQKKLILLCTELSATQEVKEKLKEKIIKSDSEQLEFWIDHMTGVLPNLREWVISGENIKSANVHLARTIARRAERYIVSLNHEEVQRSDLLKFVNRVSDYLFQLARKIDLEHQVGQIKKEVLKQMEPKHLKVAEAIAEKAIIKAVSMDVPVTVAVVDQAGHLLLMKRLDGCLLASIDIAISKAKTSVYLKMTTEAVGQLSQPGQALYGIEQSNHGLISFGGGYPIEINGEIWGGLGISGGSVDEDIKIAKAGLGIGGEDE